MTTQKTVYFPGLNGLRAVAVFSVILAHIEIYKNFLGLPVIYTSGILAIKAVSLFFVLSGFLITYLLLAELKATDKIKIKNFYIKRSLRILPLYFFVVLLGLFLIPRFLVFEPWQDDFLSNFYLLIPFYFLLIPNFATLIHGPVPFVGMFWSVGVEEQFYLTWPFILKQARRHLLLIFVVVIVSFVSLRGLHIYFKPLLTDRFFANLFGIEHHVYGVTMFLKRMQFECMAMGGIGAWLLLNNKQGILNFLYRRDVQVYTLIFLLICLYKSLSFSILDHVVYGLLFSILVINVGTNPDSIIKLENKTFNFLGKISYGLYVYHFTCIIFVMTLLRSIATKVALYNTLLYSLSLTLTILVSFLSYRYFEYPFLRYKKKFMVINSTVKSQG